MLARLITAANSVVAAETMAAELWPDLEPSRAVANLQVRLAELRRAFRQVAAADRLVTRAPGYVHPPASPGRRRGSPSARANPSPGAASRPA